MKKLMLVLFLLFLSGCFSKGEMVERCITNQVYRIQDKNNPITPELYRLICDQCKDAYKDYK